MKSRANRLWITWETHRRSREISRAIHAELVELECSYPRLLRYPLLTLKTLREVLRRRPAVTFAQNPSLILAALIVRLRRLGLLPLVVVDAHNAGLMPAEGQSAVGRWLARHVQRGADLVIVSNEQLRQTVEGNGGQAVVLPDPVPEFPAQAPRKLDGHSNVLVVCTFGSDEPYQEIVAAAGLLGHEATVYMSGDWRRARPPLSDLPSNLRLTGFLPEADYLALLHSVDAVIDLTKRKDCLVCGAYEGIAAGKPLVLSDTPVNRSFFTRGAVFVANEAPAIAAGIRAALAARAVLGEEVARLRQERDHDWQARRDVLEATIDALLSSNCKLGKSSRAYGCPPN